MPIFPFTSRQKVVLLFTGLVFCILVVFNALLFVTSEQHWQREKEISLERTFRDIKSFPDAVDKLDDILVIDATGAILHSQGFFSYLPNPADVLGNTIYRFGERSYFLVENVDPNNNMLVFAVDVTDLINQRERFLYDMSTFSLFALAAIFFVALAFTYILYEPIREIHRRARAFIPRESLENQLIRLEWNPRDDLYRLSESLNGLFIRVHDETKKLEQFSDDLAHEFGNKLFEIQSSIDLARAKQDAMGGLGRIERQVRELAGLTKSLLQLSRSEFMKAECTLYDVVTLVESLDAVENPRVSLDIKARPMACIHPELFMIAISNLVSNALKYSDADTGRVTITVDKRSIAVSDNGIGIPAQDLPHVWDRFYKVDSARTYASGHGLGLSIVRVIVEEVHHMRISISSAVDKGTTLKIEW